MKKILVLAAAAAAMAACADSPTAPAQSANSVQRSSDITCRSGYVVAYDENGNPYCAPIEGGGTQAMTRRP